MQFDLKNFLQNGRTPYRAAFSTPLAGYELDGCTLSGPADCVFSAVPTMEGAEMTLEVSADIEAECARCLDAVKEHYAFTRAYTVRLRDLEDPDFELPMSEEGCLDTEELVFQELIFEIPRVLLCSADCKGLCPICGKRKAAGCTCQPADQAAPADARLSILKQLLS